MSILGKLNGLSGIIYRAKVLYDKGNYGKALEVLDSVSTIQSITSSKKENCEMWYLTAECLLKLGKFQAAKNMLNQILKDPDCNNPFISKAEELKMYIEKLQLQL